MNNFLDFINNIPYFWFVFTIFIFRFFMKLKNVKFISSIPPVLNTSIIIILIISVCSIDFSIYNKSADILTFMLFPSIIALAYPLVENFNLIKSNKRAISLGVLVAAIVNVITVLVLAKLLHASDVITLSLVPKSITTPIAIDLSKNIGGIPELTVCIVVLTGTFGGLLGHRILSFFNIKHDFSIGVAIGATSHAFGTSRCLEKNQPQQAATSGLTLVLIAITTAILVPALLKWFL